MLQKLRKSNTAIVKTFEPEEGERGFLCSNKDSRRSPSLDFDPIDPLVSKKIATDYLAEILVAIFLELKQGEHRKQTSSDLLPGVHERTGG